MPGFFPLSILHLCIENSGKHFHHFMNHMQSLTLLQFFFIYYYHHQGGLHLIYLAARMKISVWRRADFFKKKKKLLQATVLLICSLTLFKCSSDVGILCARKCQHWRLQPAQCNHMFWYSEKSEKNCQHWTALVLKKKNRYCTRTVDQVVLQNWILPVTKRNALWYHVSV